MILLVTQITIGSVAKAHCCCLYILNLIRTLRIANKISLVGFQLFCSVIKSYFTPACQSGFSIFSGYDVGAGAPHLRRILVCGN